jgi:hypothetical protein
MRSYAYRFDAGHEPIYAYTLVIRWSGPAREGHLPDDQSCYIARSGSDFVNCDPSYATGRNDSEVSLAFPSVMGVLWVPCPPSARFKSVLDHVYFVCAYTPLVLKPVTTSDLVVLSKKVRPGVVPRRMCQ